MSHWHCSSSSRSRGLLLLVIRGCTHIIVNRVGWGTHFGSCSWFFSTYNANWKLWQKKNLRKRRTYLKSTKREWEIFVHVIIAWFVIKTWQVPFYILCLFLFPVKFNVFAFFFVAIKNSGSYLRELKCTWNRGINRNPLLMMWWIIINATNNKTISSIILIFCQNPKS